MDDLEIITNSITDIQELKEYINNIQNINNPSQYLLGFRLGIIIMNIDKIHDGLLRLEENMINKTKV